MRIPITCDHITVKRIVDDRFKDTYNTLTKDGYRFAADGLSGGFYNVFLVNDEMVQDWEWVVPDDCLSSAIESLLERFSTN